MRHFQTALLLLQNVVSEKRGYIPVSSPKGLTHIITMDLHQKEIQGFFSFPVDNLRASPFLIQYIQEEVKKNIVVFV